MIHTLSLFITSFWKFEGVSSTTSVPAYIAKDPVTATDIITSDNILDMVTSSHQGGKEVLVSVNIHNVNTFHLWLQFCFTNY